MAFCSPILLSQGIPSLHGGSGGIRRQGAPHASVIARLYRHVNENETKGFGAEGVRDVLNAALGALISSVERHGGDVLRVAGDALIVLFHQVTHARRTEMLPERWTWLL